MVLFFAENFSLAGGYHQEYRGVGNAPCQARSITGLFLFQKQLISLPETSSPGIDRIAPLPDMI
jgi:hypothetical protein